MEPIFQRGKNIWNPSLFRNLLNKLWHATLEMATEGLKGIPEFTQKIFYPSTLGSFRDSMPSGELTVMIHKEPGEAPREIRLKNMFPFMTLQDIKIATFIELQKNEIALPEFMYLCVHGSEKGKTFRSNTMSIDYTWNMPSSQSTAAFMQYIPWDLATGSKPIDSRFVESTGQRKLVSIVNRERITIEDAFFKKNITNAREKLKEIPELHVYLYKNVLAAIPGASPPSEKDWNGRLYPFFPYLSAANDTPTADQKAAANRMAVAFSRRQQFLMRLETLLDDSVPLIPMTLAGIKLLRLTWAKVKGIPGIEALFYEASANQRRPFLRLMPVEGSGISKIYLLDDNTPDIQDPKMLLSWSQERNPTPEQDYAFAKILVRKGLLNMPPIYATLRLFNDGSADCIVEPPKGLKKLEPRTDLAAFGDNLVEGLKQLPYIDGVPDIGKASIVVGFRLKKEQPAINGRLLRERLPVFTSFFQEIAPLPGEKPVLMLRYKLVSNFATEDRIQTFITQVMNRKVLRGEGLVTGLVELVADEFQIDTLEARKQVAIKLQAQSDVAIVNPDSKDFMMQNNSGIDVACFAQHPFYTFHLYNVDSLENLQRVITALSIMVSANTEDLKVGEKAAKELQRAEGQPEVVVEAPVAAAAANVPYEETNAEDIAIADEAQDYLDFFMGQEEGMETEIIAAQEGTPYPEHPSEGDTPARVVVPKAAPVEELKREIATTTMAPKEELQGVKETAVAEEEEETAETGGIANFFLNKLKEADRRLFDYNKTHPSLKRYVSKCQPTVGRQPAVLSEQQFQRMQEEYAEDPVEFQIYPLQPGDPEKPPGMIEKDYYSVLRYGTTPQNQNYYICCRYFCTKDEIMVREQDLESTVMRRPKGAPKRPGECPFCKGKVIGSRRAPKPGETILQREAKPKTDSRHLFVRFLKTTPHPEGFYLPCCFLEESPIKFSEPAFDKYRNWAGVSKPAGRSAQLLLEEDEEEAMEGRATEGPREESGMPISDYYVMLASVTKKYIIGAEKMPLEVSTLVGKGYGEAQVGLLPTIFDTYFDQDPTSLVSRTFNPQKIKEDGTGFLRIAVENRLRYQNDSFLAAIAPFYLLNSAQQMKEFLLDKITPRIFLALNYGNLALEFYNPTDPRPSRGELDVWAASELEVDVQEENELSVMRAYMSFTAFEHWLKSDETKKEFRHFGLALAQSNLIRRKGPGPGITFIVLDILKSGKLSVRCPPFGYNAEIMAGNHVGFLLHHWSGIWEPIFYVDNRPVEQRGVDIFTLTFQMVNVARWPPIVRKRLQEYMAQCSSKGRAAFTSQMSMNPMAMIPASMADRIFRQDKRIKLEGVVRDAYNHLVAFLYRDKEQQTPGYIPVPIVDDGKLFPLEDLIMDWDDPKFKRAPVDQVLKFYKTHMEGRLSLYTGYTPTRIVKARHTGIIEAIQLRNGIYVPAAPPSPELASAIDAMPTVTVDEMEWKLNHDICLEEKDSEIPDKKERMELLEFQEIFEHLRLTFSNWLAAKKDGGEFRGILEDVIFSRKLPLFEKRKRMEILLSPIIDEWITTEYTDEDKKRKHETSLLRTDCRIRAKDSCGGRCVWRQSEDAGKCMLHVPKETSLGEQDVAVSAPRVLLLRLIEELIRYGERRRQLLDQDVSRLAAFDKPITDGNQRIYPEKSAEWYELLRLEWASQKDEEPQFYEEMSRDVAPAAPLEAQEERTVLPPTLETILNGGAEADPKTGALRLFRAPFETLLIPLGLSPTQVTIGADTTALTEDMMRIILHAKGVSIIQIDMRRDPPLYIAKRSVRPSAQGIPVFIITEEGPALLMRSIAEPELLKKEDMPKGLLDILVKGKAVGQKKPGA